MANSKPENAVYTNPQRINSKENDSAKPKQHTDGVHSHSKHKEPIKKQTVTIMGDSMINYQDERKHSNSRRTVKVRSFPGATSKDLLDYCKPTAIRKPDVVILHVGTNDLNSLDEREIADNILEIKRTINNISPETKVLISEVIDRFDKEDLKDKVIFLNERLRQLVPSDDLIDNSNID